MVHRAAICCAIALALGYAGYPPANDLPTKKPASSPWVTSADKTISFRIVSAIRTSKGMKVTVALRNETNEFVYVARPFPGLMPEANYVQLYVGGKRLKYTGPIMCGVSKDLRPLAPKEQIEATQDISYLMYRGLRYARDPHVAIVYSTPAHELLNADDNIKDYVWVGRITSETVPVDSIDAFFASQ